MNSNNSIDTTDTGPIWDTYIGPVFQASRISWDSGMVSDGEVFLYKDTVRMLYVGSPDAPFQGVTSIGYAWSLDGRSWNRHDQPVMTTEQGSWDYPNMAQPIALVDGDTIRLWFGGGRLNGTGMKIGYAVSTDFIHWHNKQHILTARESWNSGGILPGPVIKEGKLFKMWFVGGISSLGQPIDESKWSTGYATSANGIDWDVNDEPVLIHGSGYEFDRNWALGGSVRKTDSGYEMWYSGGHKPPAFIIVSIAYATSKDGITWKKDEENPLFRNSGFERSSGLYGPRIVDMDGELRLYYTGWHPGPSIHLAIYDNDN